jgi:hypothetical protein
MLRIAPSVSSRLSPRRLLLASRSSRSQALSLSPSGGAKNAPKAFRFDQHREHAEPGRVRSSWWVETHPMGSEGRGRSGAHGGSRPTPWAAARAPRHRADRKLLLSALRDDRAASVIQASVAPMVGSSTAEAARPAGVRYGLELGAHMTLKPIPSCLRCARCGRYIAGLQSKRLADLLQQTLAEVIRSARQLRKLRYECERADRGLSLLASNCAATKKGKGDCRAHGGQGPTSEA